MAPNTVVVAGQVLFANDRKLALIAGPCVIESAAHADEHAAALVEITRSRGIGFVFKASFDKANRTHADAYRGPGFAQGLDILADIRNTTCPVMTDIHEAWQAGPASKAVDMLQIPALLSRQTDLIVAAAETGLPLNIKKGQFMAPWDVFHAIDKARRAGNDKVMITERGTMFGYNNLVVDMRALARMKQHGAPVIFDCTHATQQPGGRGKSSGGERVMAPVLARCAAAVGIAGVFAEVHRDPDKALSDGPCMIPLADVAGLVGDLMAIDDILPHEDE